MNNIKVGDDIFLQSAGFSLNKSPGEILKVEKVTKTQITAGGKRYMRSTGYEVGMHRGRWDRPPRIRPIEDGDFEKVKRFRMIETLKAVNYEELPTVKIEQIIGILNNN